MSSSPGPDIPAPLAAGFTEADEIQFKAALSTHRSALAVTQLNQLTNLLTKATARPSPFGWHSLFYRGRPMSATDERPCGDQLRARFRAGDPAAVEQYFQFILSLSRFPSPVQCERDLSYSAEDRSLRLSCQLPCPDALPSTVAVAYDAAADRFTEKLLSPLARANLHKSVVSQIILRTFFELFSADIDGLIKRIHFEGQIGGAPVLTLAIGRDDFLALKLAPETAVEIVEALLGAPLQIPQDTTCPPLSATRRVLNLAALSWQAFERLIRDIFEKEFDPLGGTVKLTQMSGDGGIDAVAFDPDPIRGGKIVIQAKHYTKPVSVSAVRDLYGTMMNEGAIKGILVTTATFGSASYAFAADKPLTLLNGSDFLSLMAKHGHKAKIDFSAA